jgi:hypothetical protein
MPQFGYQVLGFGAAGAVDPNAGPAGPTTVDATSRQDYASGTSGSMTLSHTVGTGTHRGLLVGVFQEDSDDIPQNPSGVTYGGVAMTSEYGSYRDSGGQKMNVWTFSLINPASGTADIVATQAAATDGPSALIAISFAGVNQTDMAYSTGSNFDAAGITWYAPSTNYAGQYITTWIITEGTSSESPGTNETAFPSSMSGDIGAAYKVATGDNEEGEWNWSGTKEGAIAVVNVLTDNYT